MHDLPEPSLIYPKVALVGWLRRFPLPAVCMWWSTFFWAAFNADNATCTLVSVAKRLTTMTLTRQLFPEAPFGAASTFQRGRAAPPAQPDQEGHAQALDNLLARWKWLTQQTQNPAASTSAAFAFLALGRLRCQLIGSDSAKAQNF